MGVQITWTDNNVGEDGHRVYRSESSMDPAALPAPLVELAPDITSYDDGTAADDTTYYYRVSAFKGLMEAVSSEASVATSGTPSIYHDDFSANADNVAPAGWTTRWKTTEVSWLVKSDAAFQGGKYLEQAQTVDGRALLTFDAIDSNPLRADIEILMTAAISTTHTGAQIAVALRASGSAGNESGYVLLFYQDRIRLGKYTAGTFAELGSYNFQISSYARYYLRVRAEGTAIKAKIWAVGSAEPAWRIEATDAAHSNGWAGVFGLTSVGGARKIGFFTAAVGGNTAPMPS